MTEPESLLRDKLAELRRWERRKRRERLLWESLFYAALAAAAVVAARALMAVDAALLWLAPAVFAAAAAAVFLLRPWRERAFLGSLKRVDDRLELRERVLTAWDILSRSRERAEGGRRPEEELVVEEAAEKLARVAVPPLLPRRRSWHAWAGAFLVVLAGAGLWLPPGGAPEAVSAVSRMAETLREHARELEERARAQDLAESRRMAEALREMAERQLDDPADDKTGIEAAVGAMVEVLEDMTRSWPTEAGLEWPVLSDAALEKLREQLQRSRTREMDGPLGKSRGEMLESLGLSSLDRQPGNSSEMSQEEIREFLDRVEREARQEQDRREMASTQQFLTELLPGDAPGESLAEAARPGGPKSEMDESPPAGRQPGNEPGKGGQEPYDPAFQARVRTHLQGLLGQGPSRGFGFRGEARPGESTVTEEAVVVRYQRQVEAELSSAEIPAEFKETIKNYFLSLGVTGRP
ncbi:MAG: hypothetical protein OXF11_10770 [Deltaproteobacteria bacterium]|nr:hypothetical protein [Deltaproteobacteria bacterium]